MLVVTSTTSKGLNNNLKRYTNNYLPLGHMYKVVDRGTTLYCINIIKKEDYRFVSSILEKESKLKDIDDFKNRPLMSKSDAKPTIIS